MKPRVLRPDQCVPTLPKRRDVPPATYLHEALRALLNRGRDLSQPMREVLLSLFLLPTRAHRSRPFLVEHLRTLLATLQPRERQVVSSLVISCLDPK